MLQHLAVASELVTRNVSVDRQSKTQRAARTERDVQLSVPVCMSVCLSLRVSVTNCHGLDVTARGRSDWPGVPNMMFAYL